MIDDLMQTIFRIKNVLDGVVTKESIELDGYEDEDKVVKIDFQ